MSIMHSKFIYNINYRETYSVQNKIRKKKQINKEKMPNSIVF